MRPSGIYAGPGERGGLRLDQAPPNRVPDQAGGLVDVGLLHDPGPVGLGGSQAVPQELREQVQERREIRKVHGLTPITGPSRLPFFGWKKKNSTVTSTKPRSNS